MAQRRDEVLRPLGGEAARDVFDIPVHPRDLATDAAEPEVEAATLENEGQMLGEVNAALARIETGTCASCGKAIAQERLNAVPYTRQCVRCARLEPRETALAEE